MSFTLPELLNSVSEQYNELIESHNQFTQKTCGSVAKTFDLKVDGAAIAVIVEMSRNENPNVPKTEIVFFGKLFLDHVKVTISPDLDEVSLAIAKYFSLQVDNNSLWLFDSIKINDKLV